MEKCLCKKNITTAEGLSIEIIKDIIHLDYEHCACGSFERAFRINYCPICGKNLKEEIKNKKEKKYTLVKRGENI